jgi:GntR family transcriptional regulator
MIAIDLDSPIPLEDQLCRAIREAIARGEVAAGDPLPSSRQLAGDLQIHWNTVARAYRRLSDEGLLSVRRGRGVVVKPLPKSTDPTPAILDRVSVAVREAITEARLNGMTLKAFGELVDGEIHRWKASG